MKLSFHGINTRELLDWTLKKGGCLEVARQLQKEGRCRFLGFSTHGSSYSYRDCYLDLDPTYKETLVGNAQIREVFKVTKAGNVAGCMVTDGKVTRGNKVRLLRDNVVIHEGTLKSLRRFKDEVKEVQHGFECGMAFENYDNILAGDVIEAFEMEEVARVL